MLNKNQLPKLFDPIDPKSYDHCQYCTNYQLYLKSIIADPNNCINDLCPNCMWFVEHVLNGIEPSSNTCPWYLDCRKELTVQ